MNGKMEDDVFLKRLGEKIHDLRKEKGLSQEELAAKLGTYHTQVGRIERGEVNTSINMLRKIAKVFGVLVSDLVKIE